MDRLDSEFMHMYGCDIDAFVHSVKEGITYRHTGAAMVIAGLMSDAQEQMEHQDTEGARQTLNRAKYLLFSAMSNELVFNTVKTFVIAEDA
jgi:hypothetical protein